MIKIQKFFYILTLLLIFNQLSYAKSSPRLDSLEKSNVKLQKELDNYNKELFKQDLDIKNLQKSIDELKNELQKQKDKQENYKIDKNSYESKINEVKILTERQDARISDINLYFVLWGALITLILVAVIWKSHKEAVNSAEEAVKKWIDESADEVLNKKANNLLDTKIEEYFKQKNIETYIEDKLLKQMDEKLKLAKAYLDDIQSKADRHLDTIEEAKEKAEKNLASVEFIYKEAKNITKESIVKIEEKESKDLTFYDYYNLGLDAIQKKNFNVANIQFEKALEKANSSEEKEKAYFMIGYSLSKQEEYDKAIEAYEKAIKINPKKDEAYYNMGNAYYDKKEYDNAIKAYKKAVDINPNNDMAYYNMGNAYTDKKEYDKAIEAYEKAIKINPKKDEAYYNMGNAYYNKKEYDNAIKAYKKAVEINTKYDKAYYNMGNVYCHLEKFNEAINAYTKALQINPNKSEAYTNLFELQLTLNQPFNKELEKEYIKRFSNQKESFIKYEMLKILQSIANNQEVNIDEWREKYKDVSLDDWSFDELDAWVAKMEDSEVKKRLIEALEVFKGHKI